MKRIAIAIAFLGFGHLAYADANSAVALAQQAGVIAGAAEACGQNVAAMNDRIQEAFNVMVADPAERTRAVIMYRQSYTTAKGEEKAHAKIPCDQVLKDYNSLPILRADYKQTVLPGLKDIQTAAPAQTPPAALPVLPQQAASAIATPAPTSQTPTLPGVTPAPQINPALQANPGATSSIPALQQPTPSVIPQANPNVGY